MLVVDKSLSFLNDMLHHPSIFRLDMLKKRYVSKSTLNSGVRLDTSALCMPYSLKQYNRLQAKIHRNRDFVIFLVFKLLERGVYISARNVAVLEVDGHIPDDSAEIGGGPGMCELDTQPLQENKNTGHPTHESKTDQGGDTSGKPEVLYCDVIAFHAKKRHIYAIVVCDDASLLQQCRLHALRVAHSIRRINPRFSTVFAFVLTVYDFEHTGNMRLCAVQTIRQRVCHPKHVGLQSANAPRAADSHCPTATYPA